MFVPITFVLISLYPASSNIGLTLPPAISPDPSGPGFSKTLALPNVPTYSCGIVVPTIGTSIKFFLASSIAFLIASGTSAALPFPIPTCPFSSPTTTTALNLKFLPPLTTFATLLIATTFSFNSIACSSRNLNVPPYFKTLILPLSQLLQVLLLFHDKYTHFCHIQQF